jgi:hypothetical protein
MAEDPTRHWRLTKWLRNAFSVTAVIALTTGAVKGVCEVPPPDPPCQRLTSPADAQVLSSLATHEPSVTDPLSQSFALWNNGKPATLAATLIASSRELQQLERTLISDARPARSPAVFFLFAPAGSGKTALMNHLRERSKAAFINLARLKTDLDAGAGKWATRESELSLLGKEVSWQPKLTAKGLDGGFEAFVARVTGSKQDYSRGILVDSLDEIHPESAMEILKSIKQYSDSHPGTIVVVAGRGEAFRDYLVQNGIAQLQVIPVPNLYVGNNALLEWYVAEYVAFKARSDIPDATKSAKLFIGLRNLLQRHPFTRSFLYPGVLGNFAVENGSYSEANGHRLEALVFHSLIERNRTTHNRPAQDNDQAWKVYTDALIQIARRYHPDPNTGVFLIGSEDVVCVTDGQSFGDANVGRVLMRSGLVNLNPVNVKQLEFFFWPHNLHRFIAAGKLE